MTDSKNGSKDNLNESNIPLLESEEKAETPEKEEEGMEMAEKGEKEGEANEKEKVKKEKKVKVVKVKKEPGPSCIDTLSSGLDMGVRDCQGINSEIDLDFSSILAEPATAHGFDPVWRLSFILFTQTKVWTYRILAALLSLPLSILWGFLLSLLSVFYVWLLRPLLRILETLLAVFKRFWTIFLGATLGPLAHTIGGVFVGCKKDGVNIV